MKKIISLLVLIIFIQSVSTAQLAPSKYFVAFTDKNNSPYSLSYPNDFLSQKSINRRLAQGYLLDTRDLPVNQAYIDSVIAAGNVVLLNKTKWLNGITIYTVDTVALQNISTLSFVQSVLPIAKKALIDTHVNPLNSYKLTEINEIINLSKKNFLKSNKAYNYGYSANQIEMINLDFLHNMGYNGSNITIAVIDAGFFSVDTFAVFDSVRNDNRILGTYDFVDSGGNVYDSHTHGMMVLSLMGGNIPGQLIGTSPGASFWLLRSEDGDTEYLIEEYNWISAAEFADSVGADIINSSLGYYEFDDPSQNHTFNDLDGNTTVVSIAANIAASKGILVVNSAGNSAQTPWQRIIVPADADSIITVGAVDENENYAPFSSVGYTADGRVKPDVVAQGQNTVVASYQGGIMTGNGTSFSSPIIAGALACLWQANPNANNIQIIDALKQSAHQYNNPDSILGYGIPNFIIANMLLSGVAVNENVNGNFLNVFPNPFNDSFSLIYFSTDTHTINIELIDFSGKVVYSENNLKTHIGYNSHTFVQLPDMAKGMYFFKLTSKSYNTVKKLVKIS